MEALLVQVEALVPFASVGCRVVFSPSIFLLNTSLVNPSVTTQIYLHHSSSKNKSVG